MDLASAKQIGAGLAVIALLGVGMGIGNIFATVVASIARNPAIQHDIRPIYFLVFALTEATGLFALVIALLILFT